MKAAVHTRYGAPEVVQIKQIDAPIPADDELLIRVHAATVNRTDCGMRTAKPWITRFFSGWRRPKFHTLGSEFAGVVEEVGASVRGFAVSDRVFGVSAQRYGAHAELMPIKASAAFATIPDGIAFEVAAASTDGAILAMTYLQRVELQPGQRILIYGASGSIGSAGVQLAKHAGAHVTAVCNTPNVETVRALGPDIVIDYLVDDFTTNGETYDFVFDAVGKHSFRKCRGSLVPGGAYLVTDLGFLWQNPWLALLTSRLKRHRKVLFPLPRYNKERVEYVKTLLESGAFSPVIDRTYPLDDIVEATKYVETQRKVGNVVIAVGPH